VLFVRAVTAETPVANERPDLSIKVDLCGNGASRLHRTRRSDAWEEHHGSAQKHPGNDSVALLAHDFFQQISRWRLVGMRLANGCEPIIANLGGRVANL